jgi:hypothetical protein
MMGTRLNGRESHHAWHPAKHLRYSVESSGVAMLFLTALFSIWPPGEPEANDLLAKSRSRMGHVGLSVIALVFVLLTLWQHCQS